MRKVQRLLFRWFLGKMNSRFLRLGLWRGIFSALVLRQFWKERHKSIIYNDVRSAVVAECPEDQIQVAAAVGSKQSLQSCPTRNLRNVRIASMFLSKGWEVHGRRCSREDCRLLWARSWGWENTMTCMLRWEGKGWILTPHCVLVHSTSRRVPRKCAWTVDELELPCASLLASA